jgi:hypothetical protein
MSLAFWNYLKKPKAYALLVVMLDAVLQQQRVHFFFWVLVSTWMSLRLLRQSHLSAIC